MQTLIISLSEHTGEKAAALIPHIGKKLFTDNVPVAAEDFSRTTLSVPILEYAPEVSIASGRTYMRSLRRTTFPASGQIWKGGYDD